jgi:hypothetical protein
MKSWNIPDLKFDLSALKVDDVLFAVDGDRGLILGVETVTEEPGQDGRFPNAEIADQQQIKRIFFFGHDEKGPFHKTDRRRYENAGLKPQ